MAFEESGDAGDTSTHVSTGILSSDRGLPLRWEALEEECCPKCGDVLAFFDHLDLYKCVCGFKITRYKLRDIVADMRTGDVRGRGCGFSMGNYDDESPF